MTDDDVKKTQANKTTQEKLIEALADLDEARRDRALEIDRMVNHIRLQKTEIGSLKNEIRNVEKTHNRQLVKSQVALNGIEEAFLGVCAAVDSGDDALERAKGELLATLSLVEWDKLTGKPRG